MKTLLVIVADQSGEETEETTDTGPTVWSQGVLERRNSLFFLWKIEDE